MNALLMAGIVVLVVWYARKRFNAPRERRRADNDALTHGLANYESPRYY